MGRIANLLFYWILFRREIVYRATRNPSFENDESDDKHNLLRTTESFPTTGISHDKTLSRNLIISLCAPGASIFIVASLSITETNDFNVRCDIMTAI